MIPRTAATWQTPEWQRMLAESFSTPRSLFDYLELDATDLPGAESASRLFAVRVPRGFASLMEKGNPKDPLLLQVLPQQAELQITPGYHLDPVGDCEKRKVKGVIHKYHGRALIVASEHCGVNCRFCFRRHFPYAESSAMRDDWQQALDYLRQAPDISEVILSGGDPLALSDAKLSSLKKRLDNIPHLQRLRIHSRLPVVIPQRICDEFLDWFSRGRLQPIMVFHINHPRELSPRLLDAIKALRDANIQLLNQTVLLKGVNDSADILQSLSEKLFANGVQPYYLHLLDPVQGAAHFDIYEADAKRIYQDLRHQLPGYMVPKLVRELAGEPAKVPIT